MNWKWRSSGQWILKGWSEFRRSFSAFAADGGQSPKHYGKRSGAFSKLDEMPIITPKPHPTTAGSPSTATIKRALHVFGNVLFFGTMGVSAVIGYYTYFYDQDTMRRKIKLRRQDPGSLSTLWCEIMEYYLEKRTYFEGEIRSFAVPRQDRLLPDMSQSSVKTLVLDLDELLVYSEWTRRSGWKVLKRPAVKHFLQELLPYYEIVVYSDQLSTYVEPIMDKLDPDHIIHRLTRPDTNYVNGKHVRDLSKLGRDITQVIMISAKPDAWALQPENTVKIKPWKNDGNDTMLLDLLPFLQFLATHHTQDVRSVVESYEGKDIPSTFRERVKQAGLEQKTLKHRGLLGTFQK